MHWYDDLPHVGYDVNGKKVLRPARGDELDKFLKTVEDPTSWYDASKPIFFVGVSDNFEGRLHSTSQRRATNHSRQKNWTSFGDCTRMRCPMQITIRTNLP